MAPFPLVNEYVMEWSSENLLALSRFDGIEAQRTANYLHAQGLVKYETVRR